MREEPPTVLLRFVPSLICRLDAWESMVNAYLIILYEALQLDLLNAVILKIEILLIASQSLLNKNGLVTLKPKELFW